jgi:methyltransferase (TIGR00027 family)
MTEIENVSDTARWVAVYRAMETARPDAIFRDPFAARLAGEKGNAIVDSMKHGRRTAWAMIVRTAIFDEIIRERIGNGNVDQIVNLAAGLDARPWRMKGLPRSLRWVDVDLPGILDHKLAIMKDETPLCDYDAVRVDLRDAAKRQALFSQLGAASRRTLVVTEGLLVYLTAEQVGALATDLHKPSSFQWWLIDIAHPRLLAIMTKYWGKNVQAGNAPFLFAPAESTKFFERYGWTEMEFRSQLEEARRLKREMPMAWLWRLLGSVRSKKVRDEFRRFSGCAVLERM